jgi:hypothetical protein
MTIKAIQTRYGNRHFRSRLEARWAVFFDKAGVKWDYEPEGFLLPSGPYLPDFYVRNAEGDSRYDQYLEIKPSSISPEEQATAEQKLRELCDMTGKEALLVIGSPEDNVRDEGFPAGAVSVRLGQGFVFRESIGEYRCEPKIQKSGSAIGYPYDPCARDEHSRLVTLAINNGSFFLHLDDIDKTPRLKIESQVAERYNDKFLPDPEGRFVRVVEKAVRTGGNVLGITFMYYDDVAGAVRAAMSARFEHGEQG